jgi:hypothetical protein
LLGQSRGCVVRTSGEAEQQEGRASIDHLRAPATLASIFFAGNPDEVRCP